MVPMVFWVAVLHWKEETFLLLPVGQFAIAPMQGVLKMLRLNPEYAGVPAEQPRQFFRFAQRAAATVSLQLAYCPQHQ
jgi:hypothetical protein